MHCKTLPFGPTKRYWRGEEVVIDLIFEGDRLTVGVASPVGPDGKPDDSVPVQIVPMDESFLDRIRRLLHL